MSHKNKTVGGLVVSLTALLAVAVFLLIGFSTRVWSPTWLVFLSIPLVSIIVDIATNRKDIVGKVTGVVASICVITFLLIGFLAHTWHPTWVIFFAIPISGTIAKMFNAAKKDADPPQGNDAA